MKGNGDADDYFDADGDYVIHLEDNAFFPYEVMFTNENGDYYNENEEDFIDYNEDDYEPVWFMEPDSRVEIDGHVFSVHTEYSGGDKLSSLSITIDGQRKVVYPALKDFFGSVFQPLSIMPQDYKELEADLTDLDFFQFTKDTDYKLDATVNPKSDDKFAWGKAPYVGRMPEEYKVVDDLNDIDMYEVLKPYEFGRGEVALEIIVGSGEQFDPDNKRYSINFLLNIPEIVNGTEVYYKSDSNTRKQLPEDDVWFNLEESYEVDYEMLTDAPEQDLFLNISIADEYSGEYTVKAVDGAFDSGAAADKALAGNSNLDITSKVLDGKAGNNGGFPVHYSPEERSEHYFTLVFYEKSGSKQPVGIYPVIVNLGQENAVFDSFLFDVNGEGVTYRNRGGYDDENDASLFTHILDEGLPASGEYYLTLDYERNGGNAVANSDVKAFISKTVEGYYDDIADAEGKANITDTLFVDGSKSQAGYKGVFNGKGKGFTVFIKDEEEPYRMTVIAEEYEPADPDEEVYGYFDNYFDVWDVYDKDGGSLDAYILPEEHDSYYTYGYQTLFINDEDADLTELTLGFSHYDRGGVEFTIHKGHEAKSGGVVESRATVFDFSKGPVALCAVSPDGKFQRDYWVTVKKKTAGKSELFINGLNVPANGSKRDVYLTDEFDNVHDILLFNNGSVPLTGITVKVSDDAKGVVLDDYWNVAAGKKGELAAFTDTSNNTYDYSHDELFNTAKIRLISDGSDDDISGTLTISADGIKDIVIALSGKQDIRLIDDLPNAGVGEPYSVQILLNNELPWRTASVEPDSSLPDGLTLSSDGLLSGTPTKAGTYTLRLTVWNIDGSGYSDNFSYTLIVSAEGSGGDTRYTVTVNGSRENDSRAGEGRYYEGDRVTIRAGSRSGYDFDEWDTSSRGVNFADDNDRTTTFRMPGNNVTVTAKWDRDNNSGSGGSSSSSNNSNNNSSYYPPRTPQSSLNSNGRAPQVTRPPEPAPQNTVQPVPPEDGSTGSYRVDQSGTDIIAAFDAETVLDNNSMALTVTAEDINASLVEAYASSNGTLPIIIDISSSQIVDGLNSGTVTVPKDAVGSLAGLSNTVFRVNFAGLGTVTIPNSALKTLNSFNGGNLSVTLSGGNGTNLQIFAGDIPVGYIPSGIFVELPASEGGNVAALVRSDGTLDILEKSVNVNGKLYAQVHSSGTVQWLNNLKQFTDIDVYDPNLAAVDFVTSHGLIEGVPGGLFAPDVPMLVTVLHRLEDKIPVPEMLFTDTVPGSWYSDAVSWAMMSGITEGYEDGSFGVDTVLTKEQLMVFLYRYSNYIGMPTIQRVDFSAHPENALISDWAREPMSWAAGAGLFNGETTLGPKEEASRLFTSKILMSFISQYLNQPY